MDPSLLNDDDKFVYDTLIQSDPSAAAKFLEEASAHYKTMETAEPTDDPVESIPGPTTDRQIPGIKEQSKTSGTGRYRTTAEVPRAKGQYDLTKQQQQELLISPIFLSEQEQKTYKTIVDRLVSEGYPDEEALRQTIDQDVVRRMGKKPGVGDPEYGQVFLQTEKELKELLKGKETAQAKAKQLLYGPQRPRQPKTTRAYDPQASGIEPRRKRMASMTQEELDKTAKELSLGELAKEALGPQIIESAEQVKTRELKAKESRYQQLININELSKQKILNENPAMGKPENKDELEKQMDEMFRASAKEYFQTIEDEARIKILFPDDELTSMTKFTDEEIKLADHLARKYTRTMIDEILAGNEFNREIKYDFLLRDDDFKELPTGKVGADLFKEEVGKLYDAGLETGAEALGYMMTASEPTKKIMKKIGLIEDEKDIVESAPMMVLRDINFFLRAIINPTLAQMGNITGGILTSGEDTAGQDYVRKQAEGGLENLLGAKRVELTKDVDWLSPIDLSEQFLRELLVETATMRGLGNDLAELEVDIPFDGKNKMLLTNQNARDFLVGAGTVAEFFIPLGAKQKAITPFGRLSMAMEKIQNPLTRNLAITAFDLYRSGGNVAGLGNQISRGLKLSGKNIPIVLQAAKDINKLTNPEVGGAIGGQLSTSAMKSIAMDTAKVQDVVANDLAGRVFALRLRAAGNEFTDYTDEMASIFSSNTFNEVQGLTSQQAASVLLDAQKAKGSFISDMAKTAELELVGNKIPDSTQWMGIRDNIAKTAKENMLAQDMADTVLLTDRVVVSQAKLEPILKEAKAKLYDANGKSLVFEVLDDQNFRLTDYGKQLVARVAESRNDEFLKTIVERLDTPVSSFEASYITNRAIDDIALSDPAARAMKPKRAEVLQAAEVPLERRTLPIPLPYVKQVINEITPPVVIKAVKDYTARAMGKRLPVPGELAQTNAQAYRIQNQIRQYEDGLQNLTMRTFSNASKSIKGFARTPGATEANTFLTINALQNKGYTFTEISSMTPEMMQRALLSDEINPAAVYSQRATAEQRNFDKTVNALEVYFGKKLSDDQILFLKGDPEFGDVGLLTGKADDFVNVPQYAKELEANFPELALDAAKPGEIKKAMIYSLIEEDRMAHYEKIFNANIESTTGAVDYRIQSQKYANQTGDVIEPEKIRRLNRSLTREMLSEIDDTGNISLDLVFANARNIVSRAGLKSELDNFIQMTNVLDELEAPTKMSEALPGMKAAVKAEIPDVPIPKKSEIADSLGIPKRETIRANYDEIIKDAPPLYKPRTVAEIKTDIAAEFPQPVRIKGEELSNRLQAAVDAQLPYTDPRAQVRTRQQARQDLEQGRFGESEQMALFPGEDIPNFDTLPPERQKELIDNIIENDKAMRRKFVQDRQALRQETLRQIRETEDIEQFIPYLDRIDEIRELDRQRQAQSSLARRAYISGKKKQFTAAQDELVLEYDELIEIEKARIKDLRAEAQQQQADELFARKQRFKSQQSKIGEIYKNEPAIRFITDLLGDEPIIQAQQFAAAMAKEGVADPKILQQRFGVQTQELGMKDFYGVDPMTRQMLSDVQTSLSRNDKVVQQNLLNLSKRTDGAGERALDYAGYTLNGLRRSLVAGQLGGKFLPNIPYQMENILTAPFLAYITNPKYAGGMVMDVPNVMVGRTPRKILREMAQREPNTKLPNTNYTYREIQDAMNRYNIGVSESGINLGDSFFADIQNVAQGFEKLVEGTPGYSAAFGDKFLGFIAQAGRTGKRGLADTMTGFVKGFYQPLTKETPPFMRWADNADRAFRENVFIRALQNGESFESAANLARTTTLDYGAMPPWARQGFAKAALYMSFQWLTGVEMLRALGTPGGAARVAAMTNFSRQLARRAGAWTYDGERAMENIFITETDQEGVVAGRLRNPWTGQLMRMGNFIDWSAGVISGRKPFNAQLSADAILEQMYIPILDYYKQLDFQYKRGVPPKEIFQIAQPRAESGINPMTFIQNPGAYIGYLMQNEQWTPYLFERYDIEIVKPERRVVGKPTINEQQYRFRSDKGYRNFVYDQMIMANFGLKRGFNDYLEALRLGGFIETPPGYDFTYYGPNAQPGLVDSLDYLIMRRRPLRIPTQQEQEYRRIKQIENELLELQRQYAK